MEGMPKTWEQGWPATQSRRWNLSCSILKTKYFCKMEDKEQIKPTGFRQQGIFSPGWFFWQRGLFTKIPTLMILQAHSSSQKSDCLTITLWIGDHGRPVCAWSGGDDHPLLPPDCGSVVKTAKRRNVGIVLWWHWLNLEETFSGAGMLSKSKMTWSSCPLRQAPATMRRKRSMWEEGGGGRGGVEASWPLLKGSL